MPYPKISRDLKLAAIRLYEGDILVLPDILDCLRISQRTFFRIWKLWNETGNVVNGDIGACGHPQVLAYEDIEYLCCVICHQPDWFLDELDFLLCNNHFIAAYYTMVHQELLRAGITAKKLKKLTLECNENVCVDYIQCMGHMTLSSLAFYMRCQRMSTLQEGIVANQERELMLFRRVFLWEKESFLKRG